MIEGAPLRHVYDREQRRFLVTYIRQPTFVEWSAVMDEIFAEAARAGTKADFDLLLDRRGIEKGADSRYVKNLVDYVDRKSVTHPAARWAFVLEGLGSFGMGRMAEQLSASGALRVFREMDAAVEWLNRERGHSAQDKP